MTVNQIILVLLIVIPLAFVLKNRLRMDTAALLMAASLGAMQAAGMGMIGPANTPEHALKAISGFSEPVVMTLLGLFIMIGALEKSGTTRWIARQLINLGGKSTSVLIGLFTGTTAMLSLIMNNLAAGALLLPAAMEVARRTGIKPSKLLIPVAFGSLLGGSATYFTTANIIMSDLLPIARPPQQSLEFLDFTPTGGLIMLAGIAFLTLAGARLLPDRTPSNAQMITRLTGSELEDIYELGQRLWEARIQPDSALVDQSLEVIDLGRSLGITVAGILRNGTSIFSPDPDTIVRRGDTLLLVGRADRVAQLTEQGLALCREAVDEHISQRGVRLVEIVLAPHSAAVGRSLRELDFRKKYHLTALAVRRLQHSHRTDIGDLKLQFGDSLLVVGDAEDINKFHDNTDFIILETSLSDQPVNRLQAAIVVAVIAAAITASIIGFPIFLSMLAGALLVILARVITMEEAYRAVEWSAIFLIAGMYAISLAMVETGLAELLGGLMIRVVTPIGPLGLAAGAYLLSTLLAQFMGGQVTALVTGPIAISAAISLGTDPQAIAVATALGCSATFFTPMGHPVNMLVMAPGNYTFSDFLRIGWRIFLISFVMLMLGMLLFWKL